MNRYAWSGIFAAGVATGLVATVSLDWAAPSLADPAPATRPSPDARPALPERKLPEFSRIFVDVVKRVRPSVVQINVTKRFRRVVRPWLDFDSFFFGGPRGGWVEEFEQPSLGSGVILDTKGHIVTNAHVVGGADEIEVALHDGRRIRARLVGVDPLTDLALIRIREKGLQPAEPGDSDRVEVGEWVLAIGSPLGYSQTVTNGIISAKERREVLNDTGMLQNFLQTSAPINPGNSGGPLVDLDGRVVGINTAIASYTGQSAGIGFAIPISMARRVAEQLAREGRVDWGWLGVEFEQQPDGVQVKGVYRNGPALRALQPGDLITAYQGKAVRTAGELHESIANTPPGTRVKIAFRRGTVSHEREIEVVLHPAVSKSR